MKTNLKNFPRIVGKNMEQATEEDVYSFLVDAAVWKEAFEKELREKLEKCEGLTEIDANNNVKDVLIGIKEILGIHHES